MKSWEAAIYSKRPSDQRLLVNKLPTITAPELVVSAIILTLFSTMLFAEEDVVIDASDPTKIYTFLGGGLKYNEYTNGESALELRVTGNIGISDVDSILFEAGYGEHDGNLVAGSNEGRTNSRFRWFHLFDIDYDLVKGYRGMGTQVDLQLAGSLKGTDGQNVVAAFYRPTHLARNGTFISC